MWTHFYDMCSGGYQKEKFEHCYIEAPIEEAKVIFFNRFGHNPERVTCTCCGDDYSISQAEDLLQITGYERGCMYAYFKDGKQIPQFEGWVTGKGHAEGVTSKYIEEPDPERSHREYVTVDEFLKRDDICVIFAQDIKPEDCKGDMPEQGYVWAD